MAFNFPYEQQYNYMQKLVTALKNKGIPKETVTALAVNAYHESYLNPWTVEGAINPGPPLGANGVNSGRDGLGLWQWTQQGNPLWSHLGDFDWQVQYMIDYKQQWDIYGTWFRTAGLPDPTPNITNYDEFMYNKKGYNDTQLTQAFIGYWERPDYTAGTQRYNSAPSEAPQFRELVDRYWGSSGGNPNHGSPGSGGSGGGVPGKPGADKDNSFTPLNEATKKVIKAFLDAYDKALNVDIPMNLNANSYSNKHARLIQKYPNVLQVKMTSDFRTAMDTLFTTMGEKAESKPTPPPNTNPSTPLPKPNSDNNTVYGAIINWCQANLGKSFNYPEAHPDAPYSPQCVDLIKAIAQKCLNNQGLYNALRNGGGGAQDIYGGANLNGTGWHRVKGDINNDTNAINIWNSLPDGAIVFWWYATYGHVAIKHGGADMVYQQNYANQGYVTHEDILYWQTQMGAGFLGAWVLD